MLLRDLRQKFRALGNPSPAKVVARGIATPDSYRHPQAGGGAATGRKQQDFAPPFIPSSLIQWRLYYVGGYFYDHLFHRPFGMGGVERTPNGRIYLGWMDLTHGVQRLAYSDDLTNWAIAPKLYDFTFATDYPYATGRNVSLLAIGEECHLYSQRSFSPDLDQDRGSYLAHASYPTNWDLFEHWTEIIRSYWDLDWSVVRRADYGAQSLVWTTQPSKRGLVRMGADLTAIDLTQIVRSIFDGSGWDNTSGWISDPVSPPEWNALAPNPVPNHVSGDPYSNPNLGAASADVGMTQNRLKRYTERIEDGGLQYTHFEPVPDDAVVEGIQVEVFTPPFDSFNWTSPAAFLTVKTVAVGNADVLLGFHLSEMSIVLNRAIAATKSGAEWDNPTARIGGPTDLWGMAAGSVVGSDLVDCGVALKLRPWTVNYGPTTDADGYVMTDAERAITARAGVFLLTFYFGAATVKKLLWVELDDSGMPMGSSEEIVSGAGGSYTVALLRYDEHDRPVVHYLKSPDQFKKATRTSPGTWAIEDWTPGMDADTLLSEFASLSGDPAYDDQNRAAVRLNGTLEYLHYDTNPGVGGMVLSQPLRGMSRPPFMLNAIARTPAEYASEYVYEEAIQTGRYIISRKLYALLVSFSDQDNGEESELTPGDFAYSDLWLLVGTLG